MSVILETSVGAIIVDLYIDERPKCCYNFLKLCQLKYFNFCSFHRIEHNVIAQSGDPTETGNGGESVYSRVGRVSRFRKDKDKLVPVWSKKRDDSSDQNDTTYFQAEPVPKIRHRKLGQISMVNNGRNEHGSQFFFSLRGEDLTHLDAQGHTVFGEVVTGFDTLVSLNDAFCDRDGRPYRDIRILHAIVLDDPFSDEVNEDYVQSKQPDKTARQVRRLAQFAPSRSPSPTFSLLAGRAGRLGVFEDENALNNLDEVQLREFLMEKEASTNAQILEMVGDLPSADCAPPENVLFVCRLNPVTSSDDLAILFSRFGEVLSCEVIRDALSGRSLQYAFIEFESREACELAYLRMDNVIVDDRRIHVDFSQSVAKIRAQIDQETRRVTRHDAKEPRVLQRTEQPSKEKQHDSGTFEKRKATYSSHRDDPPAKRNYHSDKRHRESAKDDAGNRRRRSRSRSRSKQRKRRSISGERKRKRSADRRTGTSRKSRSRSRSGSPRRDRKRKSVSRDRDRGRDRKNQDTRDKPQKSHHDRHKGRTRHDK